MHVTLENVSMSSITLINYLFNNQYANLEYFGNIVYIFTSLKALDKFSDFQAFHAGNGQVPLLLSLGLLTVSILISLNIEFPSVQSIVSLKY